MLEHILLGLAQGIGEWLPISSEGLITLIKVNFLGEISITEIIDAALFLHLGTALAAIIYFWRDIKILLREVFRFPQASVENKKTIIFLAFSTIISGGLGFILLSLIPENALTETSAQLLTILVGVMLLVTAVIQLVQMHERDFEPKNAGNLNIRDGILVSIAQAAAVVPGLSRSGLTVGAFLLLGYSKKESLRLSFLMSIPIVIAGNVVLNADRFVSFDMYSLVGLLSALVFGLLTIRVLMNIAERINFGYFVLLFGVLTIVAGVLM